jgi:hypothetical protein
MHSLLSMHVYQYKKQKYHFWIALLVGVIFLIGHTLWWLSPMDKFYVATWFIIGILEVFLMVVSLFSAVSAHNNLKSNHTHMMHAQWISYMKLYIIHWFVGILPILYIILLSACFLFVYGLWFGYANFVTALIPVSLGMQTVIIYTIVYIFAYHIHRLVAILFGIAIYVLSYSIVILESIKKIVNYGIDILISILIYITPHFINHWLYPSQQERLLSHFFSIAIAQGIYTITLLALWCVTYQYVRWK